MTIVTKVNISGTDYTVIKRIIVDKSMNDFNTSSTFSIDFDNDVGRKAATFALHNEVIIYADKDVATATTKLFSGLIEDIKFSGIPNQEIMTISGRDYSSVLQDIITDPRIFKDTEISEIVISLMLQNAPTYITTNNVNVTTTSIDKITFNNISLFDALCILAETAGFYFYIDEDKDLHFEERESIVSGLTLDNTNVLRAKFRTSEDDIFNIIKVIGDRQLTGAQEIFVTGTDNIGSVYTLDAKPSNTKVTLSGTTPLILQPGGIININDPLNDNVKYLIEYHERNVILVSGTTAGNNVYPAGSVIIIDYDRSTPLIKMATNSSSISSYGEKYKLIIDKNIKDINEATIKAATFLAEHKDAKTEGTIDVYGILSVTPGTTVIVNLPYHNQTSQTYGILNASYEFNSINNYTDSVLRISLNKKINSFIDTMKDQILRLRRLEGAETDTEVTLIELATGSIGISGTTVLKQTFIGSVFMFHTINHNLLESPTSLLGPWDGGSTVVTIS